MRVLIFLLIPFYCVYADITNVNILPSSQNRSFMHIKILDQKRLSFARLYGLKFAELSDLTYDEKTQTLYLVSDKGLLFSFHAEFSDKINRLYPLRGEKLKNQKSKRFKKWKRDSEGLTLDGKGRLLISFEGKAKIGWFHKNSARYGTLIHKYELPIPLRKTKHYRSKNKSLEALAWHPKYGILTVTEWPLKKYHKKKQTIYALSGKVWHFKAEAEGRSSVVAIEVMDDGNVLVLERSYTGLFNPFVVTLKKVYMNGCKKEMCKTKVLAKFNTHMGWDVDNFEGLARVGKHRYIMISDDNENFFQRTLLIYFEINEK